MIAKHSKELPQELEDEIQKPDIACYIWDWFCELSAERMRPTPQRITADMMKALEWYHDVKLEPWEKKALRMLDNVFFARMKK